MSTENYVLEAKNITKIFPGVVALRDASFELRPGTVHGLVGKNGAGKSTLVNILCGLYPPTSGEVYVENERITMDPQVALRKGIAVIPQEPRIAPTLSVAENLFLGILPLASSSFVSWKNVYKMTDRVLKQMGMNVDPRAKVGDLTVSDRQLLSSGKAFFVQNARVVIMDEVTAALSEEEETMLYAMIAKKKKDGAGIVFISHELEEIFRICDYVTVLRNGRAVATKSVAQLNRQDLIGLIVGERIEEYRRSVKARVQKADVVMSVENVSCRETPRDVSFKLHKGEILGLAGLRGSGRTELLKVIFGMLPRERGTIRMNGNTVDIRSTAQAMGAGIFYLPEDREAEGLFSGRSVKENVSICAIDHFVKGLGFVGHRKEAELVSGMVGRLKVLTPSLDQQVMYLSGGNKQKVILSRGLLNSPHVFLLDEPTKGIDVETKMEIRRIIVELSEHASIIIVSSEFEDLLSICDRILVMCGGRIIRDVPADEVTERDLHHCVGGIDDAKQQ
jgi:ABC-type sugar transport system ATPase subunit